MAIPHGVEVREALLPLGVVLPKLMEDHLGVGIHGAQAFLDPSIVGTWGRKLQIGLAWIGITGIEFTHDG
jgi:hypothetical protein